MLKPRFKSEKHGDYVYCVEKTESQVLIYRTPLNSPSDAPEEQVSILDLPSLSLQQAVYNFSADFGDEASAD